MEGGYPKLVRYRQVTLIWNGYENGPVQGHSQSNPLVAVAHRNAAMVTPESVAITMMATLAPLIPIPITDMVPVPLPILVAVAADAHANTLRPRARQFARPPARPWPELPHLPTQKPAFSFHSPVNAAAENGQNCIRFHKMSAGLWRIPIRSATKLCCHSVPINAALQ